VGFASLRWHNFRNLADAELAVGERTIFLVGENGQGKTNLLEAVHLLCRGSSFREKRDAALLRDAAAAAAVDGTLRDEASGPTRLSLRLEQGRPREIRVDDKLLPERRSLLERVLCIAFVQQDMDLVTGAPEERRRFVDQTIVLADPLFMDTLRSYRVVLRSRNLCLPTGREDLLDLYDGQLASLGLAIQERRRTLLRGFDEVFEPLFREITGLAETVRIRYRASWNSLHNVEEVMAHLGAQRARDRAAGTTTSGPHRDTCLYVRQDREFAPYASTGQVRLCALALRVAQARFLVERTHRAPILLLDDVLLELDPARKRAFLDRLPDHEQAFFTFLPDETWQEFRTPGTLVLAVREGRFSA
jgi:DNA replication and repair protein RecF